MFITPAPFSETATHVHNTVSVSASVFCVYITLLCSVWKGLSGIIYASDGSWPVHSVPTHQ